MPFKENIETAAGRVMDFIKDKEAVSSWQIKVSLHLSSSLLFLALGSLSAAGRIIIEPDGLNYKITKNQPNQ